MARLLGTETVRPTTYRGEAARFEPSLALGLSWRERAWREHHVECAPSASQKEETSKTGTPSSTTCLFSALNREEFGNPGPLLSVRATTCEPPDRHAKADSLATHTVTTNFSSGASEETDVLGPPIAKRAATADWRQLVEAAEALGANVPLLDTAHSRHSRWDLHPAIQGGPTANIAKLSNRFDCAHTSLAPGAFDSEMVQLQHVLSAMRSRPTLGHPT